MLMFLLETLDIRKSTLTLTSRVSSSSVFEKQLIIPSPAAFWLLPKLCERQRKIIEELFSLLLSGAEEGKSSRGQ